MVAHLLITIWSVTLYDIESYNLQEFMQVQLSSYACCLWQYHGGTNFGRSAGGPFITTSYDYDAPIDEYGETSKPVQQWNSSDI